MSSPAIIDPVIKVDAGAVGNRNPPILRAFASDNDLTFFLVKVSEQ